LLIADDHEGVLYTLGYAIDMRGSRALLANSGKAALERAATEPFDAALIDLHMPEMDGLTTCRKLRERCIAGGADRPIFMMTAAFMPQVVPKALEAGAVALLKKPFDYDEFFALLERYCRGELPLPALPPIPFANGVQPPAPSAAA
jgi:CheY-like chemotaxis protein